MLLHLRSLRPTTASAVLEKKWQGWRIEHPDFAFRSPRTGTLRPGSPAVLRTKGFAPADAVDASALLAAAGRVTKTLNPLKARGCKRGGASARGAGGVRRTTTEGGDANGNGDGGGEGGRRGSLMIGIDKGTSMFGVEDGLKGIEDKGLTTRKLNKELAKVRKLTGGELKDPTEVRFR